MAEISGSDRAKFAGEKLWGALKWMALSGTATFFLIGLLDLLAEIQLPSVITLGAYLIINTLIYSIAKYVEGEKQAE